MDENPTIAPLASRLRDGFERVATVLKIDQWAASTATGLNPTQLLLLGTLIGRSDGLRVNELARHLGISQPTVTDVIAALETKGHVQRLIDRHDARVRNVVITQTGQIALQRAAAIPSQTEDALIALPASTQTELLVQLMGVIRQFQRNGTLPHQRICGTCKYFKPYHYKDAATPHHCAFVNAAFGTADLRTNCGDHETASPAEQTAIWSDFETGRANLQAKRQT